MLQKHFRYIFILLTVTLIGCAKRGNITGGAKDTLSPVLVSSFPKNFSTNFKEKVIRLNFDEYVKLKDLSKQLVVSPPMNTPPEVTPSNASKYLTIKIKDTLKENTTYSFNFGQSIQDNNENNPYSQFRYVFSTGTYIDSLSIEGTIKDARELTTDNFVKVMLFEINETYTDSTIYKERPRYVTNTLDSLTTFKIDNIKAGTYQLIALKEENNNYKFDPATDRIGFHSTPITIPTDEKFQLQLFDEVLNFKALKPSQAGDGKLVMGYEGIPSDIKTVLKNGNEIIPTIVTRIPEKDSVNIWYKPIKVDSLSITVSKDKFVKDFVIKLKNQKKDSLSITPVQSGVLRPRERFTLKSVTPLIKFDNSKITLLKKDSTAIPFTTKYDEFEQKLEFDFERKELERYTFRILPGAMTDFFERENDTLTFAVSTREMADYGSLTLNLTNVKQYPVIVELTDAKGKILASEYSEDSPTIIFEGLDPNDFTVRIIYDTNKNRQWDPGNFLEKRQAEEIIYFKTTLGIRSNWVWREDFDLGG